MLCPLLNVLHQSFPIWHSPDVLGLQLLTFPWLGIMEVASLTYLVIARLGKALLYHCTVARQREHINRHFFCNIVTKQLLLEKWLVALLLGVERSNPIFCLLLCCVIYQEQLASPSEATIYCQTAKVTYKMFEQICRIQRR